MRGQSLVEFALVAPILLLTMLGGIAIGLALILSMDLTHAATEGAVLGAQASPGADRCQQALQGAAEALGRVVQATCEDRDGWVTVHLEQSAPLPLPGFDHWTVGATERSAYAP